MIFRIYWEEKCEAGNPRVNRKEEDNRKVWCYGWSRIDETTADRAADLFRLAFPTAVITEIT